MYINPITKTTFRHTCITVFDEQLMGTRFYTAAFSEQKWICHIIQHTHSRVISGCPTVHIIMDRG